MSSRITYTAVLNVSRESAEFVARLLRQHRERLGTRKRTRALGPFRQAVLVLRWFVDGTRIAQLAYENGMTEASSYRPRPRPGRCPERIADTLDLPTPTDLGCENAGPGFCHPIRKPKDGELTNRDKAFNAVIHGVAERANALLKVTFKALRRIVSVPQPSPVSPPPPWSCSNSNTTGPSERRPTRDSKRCRERFDHISARPMSRRQESMDHAEEWGCRDGKHGPSEEKRKRHQSDKDTRDVDQ